MPNSFIIKDNHGYKWRFIIKDKEEYLTNKEIFNYIKTRIENWLKQNFFGYSDFETQYINIKPQIIIEPLMRDDINKE